MTVFNGGPTKSHTVFTYHLNLRYLNISERLLLNSPPLTLLFLLLSFFQARVQHGTIFWVKSTMKELTCWISVPCELKVALPSLTLPVLKSDRLFGKINAQRKQCAPFDLKQLSCTFLNFTINFTVQSVYLRVSLLTDSFLSDDTWKSFSSNKTTRIFKHVTTRTWPGRSCNLLMQVCKYFLHSCSVFTAPRWFVLKLDSKYHSRQV